MALPASTATRPPVVTDPVKVMVVDDSVVARGLISRWVDEDPGLAVVSSCRNGKLAVQDIERTDPDVIVLDIEMPEMDGLTALPLLLAKKPHVQVIMASTLTRRNAEISLKALSLGAVDYVPKPESNSGVTTSSDFRRELVDKVRSIGAQAKRRGAARTAARPAAGTMHAAAPARPVPAPARAGAPVARPGAASTAASSGGSAFSFRPWSRVKPQLLLIGSSTGGPQALAKLFEAIGPHIGHLPVLVTQHMPATFTAILAEHIGKVTKRPSAEGKDGETIVPGQIYIAPGGKHMMLAGKAGALTIKLDDGPQINFCKPAVDPMFETAARLVGAGILGVVLTGMGSDGARGAVALADAGGSVIAQDEASSVVWGMPQAALKAGACAAMLSIDEIGPSVNRVLSGVRP